MIGRHGAGANARVRSAAFRRESVRTPPRLKAVLQTGIVLRTGGFTLIELIVVIALMGVATDLGMIMFFKVSDAWKRTATLTELNERADYVFDQMRRDFAETVSPSLSGLAMHGSARIAEDARFFRVPLEDDQITIPANFAVTADNRFQCVEVSYHIDREHGPHVLMRTMRDPGAALGATAKVAAGVLAMRLEYAEMGSEGLVWLVGWTKPELPRAVRVSLTMMDPVRYYDQITRKAVFPIHVN